MANSKILILESSWAEDEFQYMSDSRSASAIYCAFGAMISPEKVASVDVVRRPMLRSRFIDDLSQFIALPCNRHGANVVILSGHGYHNKVPAGSNIREIQAIDGIINPYRQFLAARGRGNLPDVSRTILIFDACSVGTNIRSFRRPPRDFLGCVGFNRAADWIASSLFILAYLAQIAEKNIFQSASSRKHKSVLDEMGGLPAYSGLMQVLGVEYDFA